MQAEAEELHETQELELEMEDPVAEEKVAVISDHQRKTLHTMVAVAVAVELAEAIPREAQAFLALSLSVTG